VVGIGEFDVASPLLAQHDIVDALNGNDHFLQLIPQHNQPLKGLMTLPSSM